MPTWLITIRNIIITQLRGQAIKQAIILLVKSGPFMGFRGWLVKVIVTHFYDDIAEPLIKMAFLNMNYEYRRIEGKILLKRVKNAENQTQYDAAIDDIFN